MRCRSARPQTTRYSTGQSFHLRLGRHLTLRSQSEAFLCVLRGRQLWDFLFKNQPQSATPAQSSQPELLFVPFVSFESSCLIRSLVLNPGALCSTSEAGPAKCNL